MNKDPKLPRLPPFSDHAKMLSDLRRCEVCGQHFDTRDQTHISHHTPEPHQPLLKT